MGDKPVVLGRVEEIWLAVLEAVAQAPLVSETVGIESNLREIRGVGAIFAFVLLQRSCNRVRVCSGVFLVELLLGTVTKSRDQQDGEHQAAGFHSVAVRKEADAHRAEERAQRRFD